MNEETTNPTAAQNQDAAAPQNPQTDVEDQAGASEKPAETPPAQADAQAHAQANAPAPAGVVVPAALFDMAPTKKEEPKKPTPAAGTKTPARPEPVTYPENTEVRYGRETVVTPKEMTAQEVLAWMGEDDYPELKYEEVEVRHDKEKNRLVVVRKAQKKGAGAELPAARRRAR